MLLIVHRFLEIRQIKQIYDFPNFRHRSENGCYGLWLMYNAVYSIREPLLYIGSYKGVIKREAVYKCTNKDYLPEA